VASSLARVERTAPPSVDSSGSAAPLVQGLVELLKAFAEGVQASGEGSA
jgi:hypothetical protein